MTALIIDYVLLKVIYEEVHFTLVLTHCGLVTLYGDRDLGQHWLR